MHWRNSSFQKLFFIAGKAHTPDEAYRLLCELKEDRAIPIAEFEAAAKRQQAKRIRAETLIKMSVDEAEKLDAEADLIEMKAHEAQSQACYDEAVRELAFIDNLILEIQPFRKYSSLPDYEAHQACQADEWEARLKFQIENQIATRGGIDSELLGVVRLHPKCDELLLAMNQMRIALHKPNGSIAIGGKNDTVAKDLIPVLAAAASKIALIEGGN